MIHVRALLTARFMIFRVDRRAVFSTWKARALPTFTMRRARFFLIRRMASNSSGTPRSCSFCTESLTILREKVCKPNDERCGGTCECGGQRRKQPATTPPYRGSTCECLLAQSYDSRDLPQHQVDGHVGRCQCLGTQDEVCHGGGLFLGSNGCSLQSLAS